MTDVEVRGAHITLGQLLKVCGVVESGGAARSYLGSCKILVNGAVETRRGRKLHPGDRVEFDGETVVLK